MPGRITSPGIWKEKNFAENKLLLCGKFCGMQRPLHLPSLHGFPPGEYCSPQILDTRNAPSSCPTPAPPHLASLYKVRMKKISPQHLAQCNTCPEAQDLIQISSAILTFMEIYFV
ncbi:hypothetical protein J6590_010117 [Homalodisca vitripennis]|nr:hypothetical protein J6590_010117 [Homalodisca vitripennis]